MKIKEILTIALTKRVLLAIEKLINLRSSIKGEENIPKSASIIFTPNHFTRFETFVMPYFLNKIEGLKFSRSLADSSLFTSQLGKYLRNLQTISTHDPHRDETIISDLAENKHNWVIYPEGKMVKDKHREIHQSFLQNRLTIRTGTAILAMKAEFQRQQKNYPHPVCIVPTTISYVPIHPKENKILSIAQRFAKKLPKRLHEELLVEGALLLNSKIIIHFHKPIYITDYIIKDLYIHKIFNSSQDTIKNAKLSKYRIPISMNVANEIYRHAQITHEHIISLLLNNLKGGQYIERKKLSFLIIVCVLELQKHSNIQEFYETLQNEKLFNIILDDGDINNFLSLLQKQGIIKVTNEHITLEQKFFETHTFDTVRIQNITRIFLNEIGYFSNTDTITKAVLKMTDDNIARVCFDGLNEAYTKRHQTTYNSTHSIQIKFGRPFFLENNTNRAVLLIHGYKASPREMRDIADFLYKKGMTCYGVRMTGHGTSPFDMAQTTHEDWLASCEIAYKILNFSFKEVDVCGFSTGGLIAIQLAKKYKVHTLTLINSALQLCDIRFRYVKFADAWSDIASKFSKNHKGYIEDVPSYPDASYTINHYSCMVELSDLMKKCNDDLYLIEVDTLIIQSDNDPVVNPKSGKIVYDGIASKTKRLEMIESDQHVITRGKEVSKIQNIIAGFML
jgi:esterase/lipase/1-acyl-sn-glycerol-3-phosphate acyltransferase